MIDLEQLKECNQREWHKAYGGQITLNCEDVDELIKAYEKACEMLTIYVMPNCSKIEMPEGVYFRDKKKQEDWILKEISK